METLRVTFSIVLFVASVIIFLGFLARVMIY